MSVTNSVLGKEVKDLSGCLETEIVGLSQQSGFKDVQNLEAFGKVLVVEALERHEDISLSQGMVFGQNVRLDQLVKVLFRGN